MTIVYRAVKGSNLTANEFDGNFHDVDDRITTLEGLTGKTIDSIDATGNVMTITYSDTTTDTITIPTATWNFRGEFQATSYAINDVFSYRGSLYVVLIAHTGSSPFDPALQSGGNDVYQLLLTVQPAPVVEISPDSDGLFNPDLSNASTFMMSTDTVTVVIPDYSTVPFPTNTELHFRQSAAGIITFDVENTDILIGHKATRLLETEEEGDVVTIKNYGPNLWVAFGNLAPV